MHEINHRFHSLKMVVGKLKRQGLHGRQTVTASRLELPFNDSEQMLMGSSVASLMSNIQEMLDDTRHNWILRHY